MFCGNCGNNCADHLASTHTKDILLVVVSLHSQDPFCIIECMFRYPPVMAYRTGQLARLHNQVTYSITNEQVTILVESKRHIAIGLGIGRPFAPCYYMMSV